MPADPTILERIRGCPFARGGRVLVRFRADGYSLVARRAAGAPAADRRGRRGRPALPLPPRLGASGRLRGGRHAARPRPRTAQRQSVLPGTPPDLLLSGGTQPANAQPQTLFPVNFRLVTYSTNTLRIALLFASLVILLPSSMI